MIRVFSDRISAELSELVADRWLLSLVSWVPLLLFFIMWYIFSAQIPRQMAFGIVDLDRSTLSRSLARHYSGSATLDITDTFLSVQEGAAALRSGKIYGLAVLPADLGKDIVLGHTPQVTVFTNNQFLLFGKVITSALLQIHGTFSAEVEVGKRLASGSKLIELAISQALPTATQVTPLFNLNLNYGQFLLSAILPAIWQILMVATTILSLSATTRNHGFKAWLGTSPFQAILSKFLPLSIFFLIQGIVFLVIMYWWLGWPMHGNISFLLFAQFITAWASIAAGSLLFFITRNADLSLSLASAYVAPGLAFMGVTFPVSDMSILARIWRSFLPISHYVEIQFEQVNYGTSIINAMPQLLALGCFSVPMIVVVFLAYWFSHTAQNEEMA